MVGIGLEFLKAQRSAFDDVSASSLELDILA